MSLRYLVDDIEIDPACFAVTRAGRPVALEPKAVTLLLHLVAHRDRVVTKDELTDLLWKETFVTPNALTRLVAQLRRELGDTATGARYIQTVHRRGYRFIGAVDERGGGVDRPQTTIAARAAASNRTLVPLAAVAIVLLAVTAFAVRFWTWQRFDTASPRAAAAQATSSLGFDTDPAISPDGRRLAWSSDRSGRTEIYVRDLDASGDGRAVTADGLENVEPSWSPDGRWIAYHSRVQRGIWVVPVEGRAEPRRVSDFGSQPAWSPDGQHIAFGASGRVMAARTQIWTVAPDGSGLAPLTAAGRPDGLHQMPAWSGDGSHLAFLAGGPGHATLWIQRLADGHLTRVRDASMVGAVALSPDDEVFWTEDVRGGAGRVWRQAFDSTRGRLVGSAIEDQTAGRALVAGLSIAGNRMAWVAARLETNLWVLPIERGGRFEPPRPLTRSTYRNAYPMFSPDGSRIAFHMKRPGAETEVWTIAPTGGEPAPLLPDNPRGFFPNWLPGGERVLAVERTARGEQFAYLDVRSGNRDPVRAVERERHPRLSPDGRRVAFHAPVDGTLQVFVAPVAGGPSRQVTRSPTDAAYPSWSPDGARLAVEVRRGEDVHVAVVSATGGPLELITAGPGLHWPHSWAPDNDRIAFAGERDGRWELYAISASTRRIRQLTSFATPNGYVRYPAWSPLDTAIAFERTEVRGNVWVAPLSSGDDDRRRTATVVDVERVEKRER